MSTQGQISTGRSVPTRDGGCPCLYWYNQETSWFRIGPPLGSYNRLFIGKLFLVVLSLGLPVFPLFSVLGCLSFVAVSPEPILVVLVSTSLSARSTLSLAGSPLLCLSLVRTWFSFVGSWGTQLLRGIYPLFVHRICMSSYRFCVDCICILSLLQLL